MPRFGNQPGSQSFVGLARGVFRTAAGALLALALTVGVLDWLARRFDSQLRHSSQVMRLAQGAYELALDRETAIRGYLLTRDSSSLTPELYAREPLSIALDSLSGLTANDPAQAERTGTVRAAVDRWANVFAVAALRDPDAALGPHGDEAELVGKTLFDAVRWSFVRLIQAEETAYNAQRRRQDLMRVFADVAIVLELAVLLAVLVRVRRRIVAQANALADQEARTRAVIEHAPDVVLLVDAEGTVRYHSPSAEELMGRAPDEIGGTTLMEGVHDGDREALERAFAEMAADRGAPRSFVCRVRHSEGSWRIVEARGTNLLHDPAVQAIVINARDVSDRVRAEEKAREAELEVLERLAAAGEARDDDTGQHTRRVGELAARIGQALGLPFDEVDLIRLAAPLHDVGKIGIPDAILRKPGRLTPDEFAIMQTHTLIGASMLAEGATRHMWMAESIARSHHEWWDGTGYPEGLAGEAIPLAARIVAVADVYDALTHARPYRGAWKRDRVIRELRRKTGTHFDPQVVQAFLEDVLSDGNLKIVVGSAA
ncbi:MAG TPA: HD domain-containing phosphohydrolase [Gemmatimonadaceae bacterium]|jgi:PAS domain S-box-containing protein|nr:HD domain-containing phosphohydrolase [Gemmatimonadaceae bacterium]